MNSTVIVVIAVGLIALGMVQRVWMRSRRAGASVVREMIRSGARIVDVRTPEEFAAGHVDGAENIPLDEVAARLGDFGEPTDAIVVYCRTGSRSSIALDILRKNGFSHAVNGGGLADMRSR
jgi:phage shock protein E